MKTNAIQTYIPISKVDEEQRMVWGYASTEALDSQGERISKSAISDALDDYMQFANIREMHGMSAVGVAKSAEIDEKGVYIGAKVVDDAAWAKVKEGVYKGFSVGGKTLKGGYDAIKKTITKMRLTEISLVDRPANPECVFDTFKADNAKADGPDDMTAEELEAEVAKAASASASATPQVSERMADIRKAAGELSYVDGKPIWDAARAIAAMDNIFSLMLSEANEETKEPEQLAQLQVAIDSLKAFVIAELQERTEGMAKGEGEGDIAKAHADTKAAQDELAAVREELAVAKAALEAKPATVPAALSAEEVEVAKAAGFELAEGATHDDLAKAALVEVAALRKRVIQLGDKPAAAPARTVVIEKGDDTNGNELAKAADEPTNNPNPANPLDVFKAALSRPVTVGVGPRIG